MSASGPWERFVCGEPVPWFNGPTHTHPRFALDTVAGRHVLLGFFASAGEAAGAGMLRAVAANRALFDDDRVCFFGVTTNPGDDAADQVTPQLPGIRYFLDYDFSLSRGYGAVGADGVYTGFWLLLDPTLRVLMAAPAAEADRVMSAVAALPSPDLHAGMAVQAPVLVVPRVFEPDFCRLLIALHQDRGGLDSGVMNEVDGRLVGVYDYSRKRRRDYFMEEEALCQAATQRIARRLLPQVRQAFAFEATRMERHVVACYDAAEGGYFRPHRDNTSAGTAHRRFAVTLNLNTEDYEGGELRFPEFGPHTYRAPTGGAVVFSCSLLHEALPVTRGRRYAYLPFLFDEAGERQQREYREWAAQADAKSTD
ncbi:2-oxoglutarate-Fe(II)-dependent oxygenase superfamily protein [Nitrospirillum amazonense]|uniref:2-oxoglutarate-Fe(II)-dependent oxygenase superfamily protein n=1 Tax=Nitrospirillum amazonense TaxID=28077 RepID=A0A560JR01_9PROT|nr:2OG-Fe(II) oxygenase [Nitrospirillum amazonense]TWB73548.1 2-oxoglutarate-Fe(II)-dependent oxygenase superfamily protein [Nitrospirillum amazonense]